MFSSFEEEQRFREAWNSVAVVRPVNYSLFTFGESVLPYYLICGDPDDTASVSMTKGEVRINRPMIITPHHSRPEFQNFFENQEEEGIVQYLLARTARFSNLKFVNHSGNKRIISSGMDAAVDQLNGQLDAEEEDHVAILTAPLQLANVAILRYAAERVWESGPDNVQELRERGFLP